MRRTENSSERGGRAPDSADQEARSLDRADRIEDLLHGILRLSYDEPLKTPIEVNRKISRNRSLNSAQRREAKSLIFDAIRWRKRIWGDIPPSVLSLDRLKTQLHEIDLQLKELNPEDLLTRSLDEISRYLSFPRFLLERWLAEFGSREAILLCLGMNKGAPLHIRVNRLRANREEVLGFLSKEGIHSRPIKILPHGIEILDRVNLRGLQIFKKGKIEIQDGGSQFAVSEAGVREGQSILDACCGAGGKSLAMAELMRNRGEIFAADSDSRNFEELEKRSKRLGIDIIKTQWVPSEEPEPLREHHEKMDGVYVDVPCSSLGTLRRSPWLKWYWDAQRLKAFPPLQSSLLNKFSRHVKPGGFLLYSTCTLQRSENQKVVGSFLEKNSEFEMNSEHLLRPDLHGTDGFYVARLLRRTS